MLQLHTLNSKQSLVVMNSLSSASAMSRICMRREKKVIKYLSRGTGAGGKESWYTETPILQTCSPLHRVKPPAHHCEASTLTSLKKSLGRRRRLAVGATKLAQQLWNPLCQLTVILMTLYLQAVGLVGQRDRQSRSLSGAQLCRAAARCWEAVVRT